MARWKKHQAPEGHVIRSDSLMRGTRMHYLAATGRARRGFLQLDAHVPRNGGIRCPGRPPVPRIRRMVARNPGHEVSAWYGQPGGNLAPTMDGRAPPYTRARRARLCRFRWFPPYGGNGENQGGFNCCCTIQQLKLTRRTDGGMRVEQLPRVYKCDLPKVPLQVGSLQKCTDLKYCFK